VVSLGESSQAHENSVAQISLESLQVGVPPSDVNSDPSFPDGLDGETAVFGFSKKPKKSQTLQLATEPFAKPSGPVNDEHTLNISDDSLESALVEDSPSMTYAALQPDQTQPMNRDRSWVKDSPTKISHGLVRPLSKSHSSGPATITEAQMLQAENLSMAQSRLLELEKEVEHLRQENEMLASAGEIAKSRANEFSNKMQDIERMKVESLSQAQMEINIYRENLVEKDRELTRAHHKIEDLQTRLAKDLRKIRVRERELENRLELSKMEKTALVRAKDDAILELKGRMDQLQGELETYKSRCSELGHKVDGQHEQLGRTVRALRLALTHLESNDTSTTVTPFKKAE